MKGKPFVLLNATTSAAGFSRARVLMCSAEAQRKGITAGMKFSEARILCADLNWKEEDPKLYLSAQSKLVQELIACSPKVSCPETGIFLLDAAGFRHLGGESRFCRNALRIAACNGFTESKIGIAGTTFAAMVASRTKRRQWYIVPPGADTNFLSLLPVRHLPVSEDMQESLRALGIKSMGEIIKLPVQAVIQRFGQEGRQAYELILARDTRQPTLPEQARNFECAAELGAPIATIQETLFVLKSMVERLASDLKKEGLWAEHLLLGFYADTLRFQERTIKLIRSSNQPKFLLEMIKLALEAEPVHREFTGLQLSISRFSQETWQQKALSLPQDIQKNNKHDQTDSGKEEISEQLILLLQRFMTRLGENAVVRPVANDQYGIENSGIWMPVLNSSQSVLPVNADYARQKAGAGALTAGLVLKRASPPIAALVELEGATPKAVLYHGQWHHIREVTIPERLSGLWWEKPLRKSYYTALVENPDSPWNVQQYSLILLVHDHEIDNWLIEGFFD